MPFYSKNVGGFPHYTTSLELNGAEYQYEVRTDILGIYCNAGPQALESPLKGQTRSSYERAQDQPAQKVQHSAFI